MRLSDSVMLFCGIWIFCTINNNSFRSRRQSTHTEYGMVENPASRVEGLSDLKDASGIVPFTVYRGFVQNASNDTRHEISISPLRTVSRVIIDAIRSRNNFSGEYTEMPALFELERLTVIFGLSSWQNVLWIVIEYDGISLENRIHGGSIAGIANREFDTERYVSSPWRKVTSDGRSYSNNGFKINPGTIGHLKLSRTGASLLSSGYSQFSGVHSLSTSSRGEVVGVSGLLTELRQLLLVNTQKPVGLLPGVLHLSPLLPSVVGVYSCRYSHCDSGSGSPVCRIASDPSRNRLSGSLEMIPGCACIAAAVLFFAAFCGAFSERNRCAFLLFAASACFFIIGYRVIYHALDLIDSIEIVPQKTLDTQSLLGYSNCRGWLWQTYSTRTSLSGRKSAAQHCPRGAPKPRPYESGSRLPNYGRLLVWRKQGSKPSQNGFAAR